MSIRDIVTQNMASPGARFDEETMAKAMAKIYAGWTPPRPIVAVPPKER